MSKDTEKNLSKIDIWQAAITEPDDLEKILDVSINKGLSEAEAEKRVKLYGPNLYSPEKNYKILGLIKQQILSPFIILLFFCATLYTLLGNISGSITIFIIIIINTLIGVIQQSRAEKAADLLKKYIEFYAKVKRDGKIVVIPSQELVPGDIVTISAEDYITADLRVIEADHLQIDESVLSGESEAIYKTGDNLSKKPTNVYEAKNILFAGTSTLSGTAVAIVIATGKNTNFSSIKKFTQKILRTSHFQKNILRISRSILYLVFTVLTLFLIFSLIYSNLKISRLILFAIALAISVIPEELPLVTLLALLEGSLNLAKKKVIVKRLESIEDLGSINILCVDKTGTLTQNKLSVIDRYLVDKLDNLDNNSEDLLINYSLLSSLSKDPIDTTISQFAINYFKNKNRNLPPTQLITAIPFDPHRGRTTTLYLIGQDYFIISKGQYEKIEDLSTNLDQEEKANLDSWIDEQSKLSRRIIAVGYKKFSKAETDKFLKENNLENNLIDTDLNLIGLFALEDPLKPGVPEAIEEAGKLGISIKILTGDSKEIALTIAKRINLIRANSKDSNNITKAITGPEYAKLEKHDKAKAAIDYQVFARVLPEQKHEIIALLKNRQNTVGFLGDGVNDAPAMKTANVSIAVQSASNVAKESADIVLADKNLAVIIDGISYGRKVFANTIKYLRITLSANLGNFYSIIIAFTYLGYLPMLPLQILLVNLITDFPMFAIGTDNVDLEDLKRPSDYKVSNLTVTAILFGFVSTIFDLIIFMLFKNSKIILRTNWFISSIITELAIIFSLRSSLKFYKEIRPSRALIILSIFSGLFALLIPCTHVGRYIFGFQTPSARDIITILAVVVAYFITNELIKIIFYKLYKHK